MHEGAAGVAMYIAPKKKKIVLVSEGFAYLLRSRPREERSILTVSIRGKGIAKKFDLP